MKLTKIALGVALSAGIAGQAMASDLLFPYVVSGGSVTTVLSFINTAPGTTGANRAVRMALNYKLPNAQGQIDNAASCSHTDRVVASSLNDLTSFDLRGRFATGAMFNDTVGGAAAGAVTDQGFLADLAAIPAFRGYVSMWNAIAVGDAGYDDNLLAANFNSLQGEAIVIDYNAGAAWGYRALSRGVALTTDGDGEVTAVGAYENWGANSGNVLFNDGAQNVPFFPMSEVQTRFFITAVDNDAGNGWAGTPGSVDVTFGGGVQSSLYNRLEVGSSHNQNVSVNCFGVVDMEDLLGAAAAYPQMAQGGFAPLSISAAGDADTSHVVKLEFGKTNTLSGVATGGTYNNAYQLAN